MLCLPNVTLLCVETRNPELAHWAIDRCLQETQFAKVVLITNLDRVGIQRPEIEYVQAPAIKTTENYSHLLLNGIEQYVLGSHVLVMQWDSFVIHPAQWSDGFLQYDYIGPIWPHHPTTPVGNGGFSLRSVKLLQAIKQSGFVQGHPEDYCICADNKEFLENQCDIQFAPVSVAEQFAVERSEWHPAFGFHGFFNFGKVLTDQELTFLLTLMPQSAFNGVDTYDLITSLREQGRISLAQKIAKKVRFQWKMRQRYFNLQCWLLGFRPA